MENYQGLNRLNSLIMCHKFYFCSMFRTLFLIFFISIFCSIPKTEAQINMSIGYNYNYASLPAVENIRTTYNEANPWFEDKFRATHSMNGLHIGLRYKIEPVGFTAFWENANATRRVAGEDPNTMTGFARKNYFRQNQFGIGVESYLGRLGYGLTLQTSNFRISTDIDGIKDRRTVDQQNYISSTFYGLFKFHGTNVLEMSLRPFFQYAWTPINISNFNTELNPTSTLPTEDFTFRNTVIGIGFIFYNGPQ